ncbi:hypothetical protein [Flagellimonas sp.]|uniref:hypothetical protein n=1 Tax=Flagellimonas sp. TaxID=2058762 RepID=UPI003B52EBE7
MKKISSLLLILALAVLSSCAGLKSSFDHSYSSARKKAGIVRVPQYKSGQGTLTWAHYDATKRGSMIYVDGNGNVRILAENPPDAAIQSITEISAKVGSVEGVENIEAALKTQRSIAELGKRTAAVNMMRDALYRLNEMYYSSVDRADKIIKRREEYMKVFSKNVTAEDFENLSTHLERIYPITSNGAIDSEDAFLKPLFKTVLDNTKEIAVEEAKAEIKIVEFSSKTAIEKSKEIQAKYETLLKFFDSVKDSLSKEEKKEYLDKIFNQKE